MDILSFIVFSILVLGSLLVGFLVAHHMLEGSFTDFEAWVLAIMGFVFTSIFVFILGIAVLKVFVSAPLLCSIALAAVGSIVFLVRKRRKQGIANLEALFVNTRSYDETYTN